MTHLNSKTEFPNNIIFFFLVLSVILLLLLRVILTSTLEQSLILQINPLGKIL